MIIYKWWLGIILIQIFAQNGFFISDMNEPIPTEEQAEKSARIEWLKRIPMYLFIELRRTWDI